MAKKKTEQKEKVEEKTTLKKDFVFAVGRRKEAIARVRLYKAANNGVLWGEKKVKKGEIFVNGKPIGEYFSGKVAEVLYMEPFRLTNTVGKYILTVKVEGGGKKGQLEATVHGISRALQLLDKEKFRSVLKKKGFLTRDARVRERRKVGTGGKARRKKQSPKR
ncbi:MAG: 30S ribosomal protein S9 [Candidatus Levybacteria bacterium]|nr:30S ribosomal protein S9 [Candidatus Levybacteria bacterium]MBI3070421.1 30S ribosomal protein S9 [Candidatus Levybacteria bacterium]